MKENLASLSLDELASLVANVKSAGKEDGQGGHPLLGRTPRPSEDRLPLSDAQERLWFLDRLSPGKPFANLPFCLELMGEVDSRAFCQAWLDIVARHEPLTSIFPVTDEGKPCLRFLSPEQCALEIEDISAFGQDEQEARVSSAISHEGSVGFDLARGPLARGRLLYHGHGRFTFLYNFHHIVFDGWSAGIFMEELFRAYEARCAGKELALPELSARYSDYAIWYKKHMDMPEVAEDLRWWEAHLAGIEDLELPADFSRKAEQSFAGKTVTFAVSDEVKRQTQDFALENKGTPFMFWLSVFALVLGRYAGQNAFAMGSTVAGRDHPATESLVGFFVNNLIVKVGFSPSMTAREYFIAMRESVLASFRHGNLPFQSIAEKMGRNLDLSRNPIFQATLTYQNFSLPSTLPQGLSLRSRLVPPQSSHMDLDLLLAPEEAGLTGYLLYATDLFTPNTAGDIAKSIVEMARVIIRQPDALLAELLRCADVFPAHSDYEGSLLSTPPEAYPVASPWDFFMEQTRLHPESPALVLSDDFLDGPDLDRESGTDGRTRTITYSQLAVIAESMTAEFASSGVGKGQVTALLMLSGVELIAAMLAVWRQGGVWVPLDPNHPPSRQYEVLRNSGASCLLGLPRHLETLALESNGLSHIRAHGISPWRDAVAQDDVPAQNDMDAADIVCILHTSGSTGVPKGIPITLNGFCHRIAWMQARHPARSDDLTCQKTSPLFGDYVAETFGSLLSGIPVLLLGHDSSLDAGRLMNKMEQYNVTQVGLVTSLLATMHRISDGLHGRLPSLRRIVSSGEAMPSELAAATCEAVPGVRIINLYGSMEALDMTWFECAKENTGSLPAGEGLPAGQPLPGVCVALLDANLVPVPKGKPGIVYVTGPGLMPGYLSGGSGDSFVTTSLRGKPERWFKVGDMGRIDAEGRLIYQGRKDQQIKVRGVRVEPQEVRQKILEFPGVEDALVTAWRDPQENTRLVAFIVAEKPCNRRKDQREFSGLRPFLLERLPAVMLPDFTMTVDAWPRTPSGKIHTPRLLEMLEAHVRSVAPPPKVDALSIEGVLHRLWAKVVGTGCTSLRMNFFEAGGNSLLLVDLHEKIQREFAVTFPLTVLFQNPTIESQAGYLRRQHSTPSPASSPRVHGGEQASRRAVSTATSRLRARGLQSATSTEVV